MTEKTTTHARIYPSLTIENLAWAAYVDMLQHPDDHGGFDIHNEDFDTRAVAITEDLHDFIENELHYNWLEYFYSQEKLQEYSANGDGLPQFRIDALLGVDGVTGRNGERFDWNDRYKQVDVLAQLIATMMDEKG